MVLAVGVGGAAGVILGGMAGQWLYNRRKASMPVFIGVCTILGTVPLWYLVNAEIQGATGLAFTMALFTGLLSSTVGPNMRQDHGRQQLPWWQHCAT